MKEAIFNLRVNTGNSVNDINNFDKSVDELNKSVKETQTTLESGKGVDAFEKQLNDLDAKLKEGNLSIRQQSKLIREYQTIALQAGESTPVGRRAIDSAAQLTDRLGDLRAQTTALSSDTVKLDTALQGISTGAAVFQGMQSAIALTGVESEELVKTMVKLQAVQGLVNAVQTVANNLNKTTTLGIQLRIGLEKAKNFVMTGSIAGTTALATAEGGLTVATTASTFALKALRGALIATGIGALIVGIGLLIENFDKVTKVVQSLSGYVQKAYDYFNNLGSGVKVLISIFFPFIGVVYGAIKALEYFNIIDNKTERDQKARHEANMKRIDKSLAKQEQQRKAKEKAYNDEDKSLGRQIALLEAQGKSSDALVEKRIKNSIAYQKSLLEELQLNERILKATNTLGVNDELIKSTQEAIQQTTDAILDAENQLDINKANLDKKRADDAKKVNEDKLKKDQEYNKKLTEYYDALEAERQSKITDAKEKELQALDNKYQELYAKADAAGQSDKDLIAKQQIEIAEINDKYAQIEISEALKIQKEIDARKTEAQNEYQLQLEVLSEKNRQMVLTEQQVEIQAVNEKYFELEELAKDNAEELAIIQTAKANELNEINIKYQNEEIELAKKTKEELAKIEKEKQDKAFETLEKIIGVARQVQGAFSALSNLRNVEDQERLKQVEKGSEEEEKIKRRMFEREKKMRLAQVAIDTASNIVTSIKNAGGFPIGVPMGLLALTTGLLQAQAIKKTTFDAGTPPDSTSLPTGVSSSTFSQSSNTNETDLTQQNQQPQMAKVVVVESDITKIQNRVKVQEAVSTY